MTAQGSALSRFERACARGNPNIVIPALLELPRPVQLRDALRAVLVLAAARDERYDRYAGRFASRLISERRLGLHEAQLVLAALGALPGPEAQAGAEALATLLERHGETDAAAHLERWLADHGRG